MRKKAEQVDAYIELLLRYNTTHNLLKRKTKQVKQTIKHKQINQLKNRQTKQIISGNHSYTYSIRNHHSFA